MSRPKRCKMCKRVCKTKSRQGLCTGCSIRKNKMVARQLHKKKGKYYKKWKLNLMESIRRQPM